MTIQVHIQVDASERDAVGVATVSHSDRPEDVVGPPSDVRRLDPGESATFCVYAGQSLVVFEPEDG